MPVKQVKKTLIVGGIKYKLKDFITDERKKKVEKHPQASQNFIFKKRYSSWFWYVRTTGGNSGMNIFNPNTSLFEKRKKEKN